MHPEQQIQFQEKQNFWQRPRYSLWLQWPLLQIRWTELCKSTGPVSRTLHLASSKTTFAPSSGRLEFYSSSRHLASWRPRSRSAVHRPFLVRPTLAATRPRLRAEPERGGTDSTLWATLTPARGSGRASLGREATNGALAPGPSGAAWSPQSSAPAQATPGNAHIRETRGGRRRRRHGVEGKMAAAAMAWCWGESQVLATPRRAALAGRSPPACVPALPHPEPGATLGALGDGLRAAAAPALGPAAAVQKPHRPLQVGPEPAPRVGLALLGSPCRRGGGRPGPRPSPLAGVQGPRWPGGLSRPGLGLTGADCADRSRALPWGSGGWPHPAPQGEPGGTEASEVRAGLGRAGGGSGRQPPLPALEGRGAKGGFFHARLHQTGLTSLASQRASRRGPPLKQSWEPLQLAAIC
jgi:hypothetical protein